LDYIRTDLKEDGRICGVLGCSQLAQDIIQWKNLCQCCDKTPRSNKDRHSPHSPYLIKNICGFYGNSNHTTVFKEGH